ncbi:BrnT family toxin [Modicisalibacter radicis]|uniref:BrnT family toxin n=1 Tax=Halomonas sp. EAR18 TaxID=2518972 RepID=UPI00109C744C|nr:BrnT family toxin [Halomonas sp. EAR18]
MIIEFDPDKNARNERERGLPFKAVERFDWEAAVFSEDNRFDYLERRFIALGKIGQRVHVVCFTPIAEGIRVISLRKANPREVRRYENATHG